MADAIDLANEVLTEGLDASVAEVRAAAAEIPAGEPGVCDTAVTTAPAWWRTGSASAARPAVTGGAGERQSQHPLEPGHDRRCMLPLEGGATYAAVGEALGVAKEAVAGLVYRLRLKKDPRLPVQLLTPQSGKAHGGQRSRPENIGPGMTTMALKPAIGDLRNDRVRVNDARYGCEKLLRAQLRAGQHLLSKNLAIAVGGTLGMHPGSVRAAASDRTAEAR